MGRPIFSPGKEWAGGKFRPVTPGVTEKKKDLHRREKEEK